MYFCAGHISTPSKLINFFASDSLEYRGRRVDPVGRTTHRHEWPLGIALILRLSCTATFIQLSLMCGSAMTIMRRWRLLQRPAGRGAINLARLAHAAYHAIALQASCLQIGGRRERQARVEAPIGKPRPIFNNPVNRLKRLDHYQSALGIRAKPVCR